MYVCIPSLPYSLKCVCFNIGLIPKAPDLTGPWLTPHLL